MWHLPKDFSMDRFCSLDWRHPQPARSSHFRGKLILCLIATFLIFATVPSLESVSQADNLTLEISGKTIELDGEILIEAVDKSLYFQSIDGKIWFVKPDQIKAKTDDDSEIKPISKKQLGKQLLTELPDGFRIYETKHYVIAYQNELAYARWIGGLYESRLYRAFETFWKKKKKFDLDKPSFPLAAIIFGSKAQYDQHVQRELGAGQTMVAYYNLQTNRVTMYDLTSDRRNPSQDLDDRKIDQILRNPGLVNDGRLRNFIQYYPNREKDALKKMLESDDRLRDPETALDGYAEAWAFNHFLLNKHSEAFVDYLKFMSTKKALITDEPATRVADFKKFLGEDLGALDEEFIEYVRGLK
jgi:hypothetical protein